MTIVDVWNVWTIRPQGGARIVRTFATREEAEQFVETSDLQGFEIAAGQELRVKV